MIKLFKSKNQSVKRHIAKTISYRAISSLIGFFIMWFSTKNLKYGIMFGMAEIIYKPIQYFIHERIWYKINFGLNNRASVNNIYNHNIDITKKKLDDFNKYKSIVLWITGLSGSGKSTLANSLNNNLFNLGYKSVVLDGDNLRLGINKDLSFSIKDRIENNRRVAEIAKLFNQNGTIVIVSTISPYKVTRNDAKKIIGDNIFHEIYLKCNLEICKQRDPKGLYKLVESSKIENFTGIDNVYEIPESPNLIIDTMYNDINTNTSLLYEYLLENIKSNEI